MHLMMIKKQYNKQTFTGNLDRGAGATILFIIEEAKETVLNFSKETVKLL